MLPGATVAAFVYDYAAAAWTSVGWIPADPSWGKLSPASSTMLVWGGAQRSDCAEYPRADHFRHAPFAVVGDTVITSTANGDSVLPGACPATVTPIPNRSFRRYQAGSVTGPAGL